MPRNTTLIIFLRLDKTKAPSGQVRRYEIVCWSATQLPKSGGWRVTFPAALPARYRRTPNVADLLLTQAVLERVGVDYHLVHQTSVQRLTNEYTYSHAFLIARLCYPILIRRGRPSAELRHRLSEESVLEFVLRVPGFKHLAHLFERLMRRRLHFLARPLGAIKRRSLYLSTRLECAFP